MSMHDRSVPCTDCEPRFSIRRCGRCRRAAGARAAAAVSLVVLASAVDVATGASLVRVSTGNPYASCSTAGQAGRNYPSAEVEPHAAVNPRDPRNVIAVWQQDRWSDGGARGLVAGASFDGGASFTEVALPFSRCAEGGADFLRASDPWVSFGPDGTAYAVGLGVSRDTDTPATAIVAATSTDGGRTWGNLRVIQQDAMPRLFNDKETVTADALTPGAAYVVWDRLEDAEDPFFTGPALFSKTIDGGRTWSEPKVIVQTGVSSQTLGNVIVTGSSGGGPLYNFFTLIVDSGPHKGPNVAFVKSTDGGETWSPPRIISPLKSIGFTDHRTRLPGRTADILLSAAIDPASGDLYVVWADSRFSGGQYDEVAVATSTDGGETFTDPARVNPSNGKAALTPTVAVGYRGDVAITWYEVAANRTGALPVRYLLARSPRGATAFGTPVPVVDQPFDWLTAPFARGMFLGDYAGLVPLGEGFLPVFAKTNSEDFSNPTDIVTAYIDGRTPRPGQ